MGILRIVEEILEHKPNTHIVINSLLPMTALRGDDYPVISDVQDAFSGSDNVEIEKKDEPETTKGGNSTRRRRRQLAPVDVLTNENTKKSESKEDKEKELKKIKELEVTAEKEEQTRDKKQMKKRKKGGTNRDALMRDKKKVRKFKPGHLRKNTLPLWTSIQAINSALQKFVLKNKDRVSYFDADSLFVIRGANSTKGSKSTLRTDRTTTKGHPTITGFTAYEEKINVYLQKLLVDLHFDKKDPSELFSPSLGEDDRFQKESDAGTLHSGNNDADTSNDESENQEYGGDDDFVNDDDADVKGLFRNGNDDDSSLGENEGRPSTGDDDLVDYDELMRPNDEEFDNDDGRFSFTDDFF
jgi:hypothetical protein